ncbi:RNA polymerase sigma factor [Bacteroides reticulotermitis]|uniref:RNA polymerase ECF-type sigma factor n=2 Tax=Bacteroides reticulotermitis TaxID=1133319 RepID=W4UZF6_9BACE|nr:sigma-70 family RNA polymerase sigma factor [Bacteroides reticulotermitis]MBB4046094.1 RNA polymerase sigma-70 factor (ECF subfamily) [Bacteroides reticulotermitis]GAE85928.1 RNA polymerase ECF-type sigma factor [Bacteroides reticulotermitis JCM 10512]
MIHKDIKEQFMDMLEQHIGIILKISGAYAYTQEDRKDLMQDIILELWKSLKRYNGSCKMSTWIYRISLNISMNYKRKQNNTFVIASLSDFKEKEIASWIDKQNDLSELEILYSCINELSEINKAIILLYLDGNSHEEISDITGITKTNIGTRISRIKSELRKMAHAKE